MSSTVPNSPPVVNATSGLFNQNLITFVTLIFGGKVNEAFAFLSSMSPNEQYGIYVSVGVSTLLIIVICTTLGLLVWFRWLRYLFSETSPSPEESSGMTESEKKFVASIESAKEEKFSQEPTDVVYLPPPFNDAEVVVHPDAQKSPVEWLSLETLVNAIRKNEQNYCVYKNKIFERMMKLCENHLDILRSSIMIEMQKHIDHKKQTKHEPEFESDLTLFRILSTSSRLSILAHMRGFLRFDDRALESVLNETPVYDKDEIDAKLQFLKSKYLDVFQSNQCFRSSLTILDISQVLDDLDDQFRELITSLLASHRTSVRNLLDRIETDNAEIERYKKVFLGFDR